MYDLDSIIERLDRHHQPVTYGAIAQLLGRLPHGLMIGRPRNPLNSWVVSKAERSPTGYLPNEIHPGLPQALEENGVIETSRDLEDWLAAHP